MLKVVVEVDEHGADESQRHQVQGGLAALHQRVGDEHETVKALTQRRRMSLEHEIRELTVEQRLSDFVLDETLDGPATVWKSVQLK